LYVTNGFNQLKPFPMKNQPGTTTEAILAASITSLISAATADATIHAYSFSSNNTYYYSGSASPLTAHTLYVDIDGGSVGYTSNVGCELRFNGTTILQSGVAINGPAGAAFAQNFKELVNGSNLIKALALNASVGASKNFVSVKGTIYQGLTAGNFAQGFTSGTNYIGFSFLSNGKTCYGWMEIELSVVNNGGGWTSEAVLEIIAIAYDNSGSKILVGAVPEPAQTAIGLGALALGAAGLMRWRKSKNAECIR
jgi:hypothetical protein